MERSKLALQIHEYRSSGIIYSVKLLFDQGQYALSKYFRYLPRDRIFFEKRIIRHVKEKWIIGGKRHVQSTFEQLQRHDRNNKNTKVSIQSIHRYTTYLLVTPTLGNGFDLIFLKRKLFDSGLKLKPIYLSFRIASSIIVSIVRDIEVNHINIIIFKVQLT